MSKSVADSATAALRDLLARGLYQPGDRLPPERDLSTGLELSRPTLREAIRQLTEVGLLEARRGSGTYVADVDLDAVFEVRMQLEPFAASLAARHRDEADVERLLGLRDALGATVDRAEAFAAADLEVHRTLARATANPILEGVLERLSELAQLSRAITSPERDAREAALVHLEALIDAVGQRDEARAARAMKTHLKAVRDIAAVARPRDRRIAGSERQLAS